MSPRLCRPTIFVLHVALLGAVTAAACTSGGSKPTTLSVLASAELADMQPLLDALRRDTGITLDMDYRGTVDASNALAPGGYRHDLAWLSSDRYFQLELEESDIVRDTPERPISIVLMTDGENNAGISLDEFTRRHASQPPAARGVQTFPIRFGDADADELERVARLTGGRTADATAGSLTDAFEEVRDCGR